MEKHMAALAAEPSCIKGEWVYYPEGKLQNALRSDKDRGHTDLIRQYYVTKYKKKLFEFYDNLRKSPCIDINKLKRTENEIRSSYHRGDFFFPPVDATYINPKNFDLMYAAIDDILNSDIYRNNEECSEFVENIVGNGIESALGSAVNVLHKLAMGHGEEELEIEAMKQTGIILVRSNNNFDMYTYNKNHVISCLEAICAANQNPGRVKKGMTGNLYSKETLETKIYVNTFAGAKTKKTITVKDLLAGEEPQENFDVPGSQLPVQPFSKAAQMQTDLSRQMWQQRTSENRNYS
jgi:hypothetical protein